MLPMKEVLESDSICLVEEQWNVGKKLFNRMIGSFYKTMLQEEIIKVYKHLDFLKKKPNSVRFM